MNDPIDRAGLILLCLIIFVALFPLVSGYTFSPHDGSVSHSIISADKADGNLTFRADSEDKVLIRADKSYKSTFSLYNSTRFGFVNDGQKDGNLSEGYQNGDDIFTINRIVETDIGNITNSNYYTFSNNTIYIDDWNDSDTRFRFEQGDDIYRFQKLNGDPVILTEGIYYQTFPNNYTYVNLDNSSTPTGDEAYVVSEDRKLDGNDTIVKSGEQQSLSKLQETDYQTINDRSGVEGYESGTQSRYGEPIYNSGGDGLVDPGTDSRISPITIYSSLDSNISTIDLGLSRKTLVKNGDEDVGYKLSDLNQSVTVNEIDPDGSANSPVGAFGSEDVIVLDVSGNSTFEPGEDIVLYGTSSKRQIYDTTNVSGSWKDGVNDSSAVVIYDVGNDEGSSPDLLLSNDDETIGSAQWYNSDTLGKIRFTGGSKADSYNPDVDGLYIDIGNDNVTSDTNIDYRLSNFSTSYANGTQVQRGDLDSGLTVEDFSGSDTYIDLDQNGDLNWGEPIIHSHDRYLTDDDEIVVKEYRQRSLNYFNHSGNVLQLIQGTDGYSESDPVIQIWADYNNSSKGYHTNITTAGKSIGLASFPTKTTSLLTYKSPSKPFEDGDQIYRLDAINFSKHQIIDSNSKIELREFSSEIGYVTNDSTIDASDGIYKENDNQTVGDQTFGDRLTTVTVRNNGTLPDSEIKRVTLLADGTAIANTSNATNGTWVLQPDPADAYFGPTGNGTNFTLETTLADNATGGETVSLWIPSANDSGTNGSYDPGDTGLFFDQDSPTGDIGPGTTLTVEAEDGSSGGNSGDSSVPDPAIDIQLDTRNLTTAAESLPVAIETNVTNRTLQVDLRYNSNNTTVSTRTVVTDPSGEANTSFGTPPGRFHVTVKETKTGATSRTDAFDIEQPPSVRFHKSSYTVERGGIAALGVSMRNADHVGFSIVGPSGRLHITGGVTNASDVDTDRVRIDTTALGERRIDSGIEMDSSGPSVLIVNETADAKNITWLGTMAGLPDGSKHSVSNAPPGVLPPGRERPLGAGRYNISLYHDGNRTDSTTLRVTADWSGTVRTLVAPAGEPLTSASQIRTVATPRSEIATSDRLVIAVNASSLHGYGLRPVDRNDTGMGKPNRSLVAGAGGNETKSSQERAVNGTGPGILPPANQSAANASVPANSSAGHPPVGKGQTGRNGPSNGSAGANGAGPAGATPQHAVGPPGAFAAVGPADAESRGPGLANLGFRRVPDPDSETVYLVAPADANLTEALEPGQRYGARFVLNESSPFVPGLATDDERRESIGRNFTAVEPAANFASVSENGTLDLDPVEGVPVNGTTSVAPGTVLTVAVNFSEENAASTTKSQTTVEEDGTYETEMDLAAYDSGTNYTVSVSANGERISPLRTGTLTETDSAGSAAATGAGGGSASAVEGGSAATSTAGQGTSVGPTSTPGPTDGATSSRGPIDLDDLKDIPPRTLPDIPSPVRLGSESLVAIFSGLLALLGIAIGLRKLL